MKSEGNIKNVRLKLAAFFGCLMFLLASGCVTQSNVIQPTSRHSGEVARTEASQYFDSVLSAGGNITVLFVCSPEKVFYVGPPGTEPGQDWKVSSATAIETNNIAWFLRHYGSDPNASVVERDALDKLLEEMELQVADLLDTDTIVRVGKMTGANHLAILEGHSYQQNEYSYANTAIRRIINLATGQVKAVDKERRQYRVDRKTGQHDLVGYWLNDRPCVPGTDGEWYYR